MTSGGDMDIREFEFREKTRPAVEKLYRIQIGSVLHLCDDDTFNSIRDLAVSALKKGETVVWQNGDTQWICHHIVVDNMESPFASERYTWNKSGNKTLHLIALYTSNRGLINSKNCIGMTYRKP